jgi:hypothetical protein
MDSQSNGVAELEGEAVRAADPLQKEDWWTELVIAATSRANVLLVGAGNLPILERLLEVDLQKEAIMSWRSGEVLELPAPGLASTFILHNVNELDRTEQYELLRWLDNVRGWIRVISTADESPWPRVLGGLFDETLYYRLNTVHIDMFDLASRPRE